MSVGGSALLASVATYTVLVTLLVAVVERISRPGALPAALTAHRVLPAGAARPLAVLVTAAEVGLAGVLTAGVLAGSTALLTGGLLGAAALFAGYGGYAAHLVSAGRTVPCGCGRTDLPMSGWVVTRAGVLAGLAVTGAAMTGALLPLTTPGAPLLITLLAAGTFGALLWQLPAAMNDPLEATP